MMWSGPFGCGIVAIILGFFLKRGFTFFPIRLLGTLIYTNGIFIVALAVVVKIGNSVFG